jgi:hypothetical protein
MQFFDGGWAEARRKAPRKRAHLQRKVVMAVLVCFAILGLGDRGLVFETRLSFEAGFAAQATCDGTVAAFEVTVPGNGDWQREQPEAVRQQGREADVSANRPKRVQSGTSPSLSAGVLSRMA